MEKSLILIINEDKFFLSHRTPIARKAKENGWDVTLVTKDTGKKEEILKRGYKYIELPINPTGMNPKDELSTFKFFLKLFKDNPNSIIHLVGLKNMMWGGIAARCVKTKGVVFAVSGLGTLFGEGKSSLISFVIQKFLKFGMHRKNGAVIFQNHEDEKLFQDNGMLGDCLKYFTKGSGVDLNRFKEKSSEEHKPLKIIFTGRMLKEKGIEDLIQAAEILRPRYEGRVEFILCGDLSSNPRALTRAELEKQIDHKYIKWLGYCENIPELLSESDIICFPSYYREGVPKSLLEASAIGLPIVTTDSVGCRDTVEEGKNGFLVPPHSPEEIAQRLEILIEDKNLRDKMGHYSRQKAEKEYNAEDVANKHLEIYDTLFSHSK